MKAVFFADASGWREWLRRNHKTAPELWVGYYKQGTGKATMTWSESVDQALCYGWIDGLRRSIDEDRYSIRFTPRRPESTWSAINVRKVEELTGRRLMRAAGIRAFAGRRHTNARPVAEDPVTLGKEYERKFRASPKAWKFFQDPPPSTRKLSIRWVMSAKKEETRWRRLAALIESSRNGERISPLK